MFRTIKNRFIAVVRLLNRVVTPDYSMWSSKAIMPYLQRRVNINNFFTVKDVVDIIHLRSLLNTTTSIISIMDKNKMSEQEQDKKGSSLFFSILKNSFIVVVVIIVYGFYSSDSILSVTCRANHNGEGSCQFTNQNILPSAKCAKVKISNIESAAFVESETVCSGMVLPRETIEKNIYLNIQEVCNSECNLEIL